MGISPLTFTNLNLRYKSMIELKILDTTHNTKKAAIAISGYQNGFNLKKFNNKVLLASILTSKVPPNNKTVTLSADANVDSKIEMDDVNKSKMIGDNPYKLK